MNKQRVMHNATLSRSRGKASRGLALALRSVSGQASWRRPILLGILLLGVASARLGDHQAWAETNCTIPENLALRDISLPAAKQEVAADQRLTVLTFGGVRIAGEDADAQGATYPARLSAALRAALPGTTVAVVNEAPPGRTSADVPAALPGLIAKSGSKVVIWGPGGRDLAGRLSLDTFAKAVNGGIGAVRQAGADLILLDTTFVPSPARMAQIEGYRQILLSTAAENQVPVLRRHDLMRKWSEDGTLNLTARDTAERERVVRRLFSCVAQGLAEAIAEAVR